MNIKGIIYEEGDNSRMKKPIFLLLVSFGAILLFTALLTSFISINHSINESITILSSTPKYQFVLKPSVPTVKIQPKYQFVFKPQPVPVVNGTEEVKQRKSGHLQEGITMSGKIIVGDSSGVGITMDGKVVLMLPGGMIMDPITGKTEFGIGW